LNARMKRRLVVVTGLIVIVFVVVAAVVGSFTSSRSVTVAQALAPEMKGQRVQVSGQVVNNSYSIEGDTLVFKIFDDAALSGVSTQSGISGQSGLSEQSGLSAQSGVATTTPSDGAGQLVVRYEGGVTATFGNGVTAICTGIINESGILICSELVTKCPSKYESATEALTVSQLLGYGQAIQGKPLKVAGSVQPGSLRPVGQGARLVLRDNNGVETIEIYYDGALANEIGDDSALVITGSLNASGAVDATDISLEG
jgi:cytochrome c-type biogenesis protein CcmE